MHGLATVIDARHLRLVFLPVVTRIWQGNTITMEGPTIAWDDPPINTWHVAEAWSIRHHRPRQRWAAPK